jgi:hypothetical protein
MNTIATPIATDRAVLKEELTLKCERYSQAACPVMQRNSKASVSTTTHA